MTDETMEVHFSRLAPVYNELRTTDPDPVRYIAQYLAPRVPERCADIGCGSGRYGLLLMQHLPGVHLTCCDINQAMLDESARYLDRHGESRFVLRLAAAEALSRKDAMFDCVVSFNAVHHFDVDAFLASAGDTLRPGGHLFIYTRLRSQNAASVWGRHFPGFAAKEKRLFELSDLRRWASNVDALRLQHVETFEYRRTASLRRLAELARSRHYSTFRLYTDPELHAAIELFTCRIRDQYRNPSAIEWQDGNVMAVLRKP